MRTSCVPCRNRVCRPPSTDPLLKFTFAAIYRRSKSRASLTRLSGVAVGPRGAHTHTGGARNIPVDINLNIEKMRTHNIIIFNIHKISSLSRDVARRALRAGAHNSHTSQLPPRPPWPRPTHLPRRHPGKIHPGKIHRNVAAYTCFQSTWLRVRVGVRDLGLGFGLGCRVRV